MAYELDKLCNNKHIVVLISNTTDNVIKTISSLKDLYNFFVGMKKDFNDYFGYSEIVNAFCDMYICFETDKKYLEILKIKYPKEFDIKDFILDGE